LQPLEIKQNRQRNRWKCLEKKAKNLEMFGVDLEKLGGPEAGKARQACQRFGMDLDTRSRKCTVIQVIT
jgi:hypothetical protein